MSLEDHYAIFLAPEGSETWKVAHAICDERAAAHQAQAKYVLEKGAQSYYANERHVYALVYKEQQPMHKSRKLFKRHMGEGYAYCPRENTAEGKVWAAEMDALPTAPANEAFAKRLNGPYFIIHGRTLVNPYFDKKDGKLFVFWPTPYQGEEAEGRDPSETKQFVPPGCREAKRSEYYAAVEADEAKKGTKK